MERESRVDTTEVNRNGNETFPQNSGGFLIDAGIRLEEATGDELTGRLRLIRSSVPNLGGERTQDDAW